MKDHRTDQEKSRWMKKPAESIVFKTISGIVVLLTLIYLVVCFIGLQSFSDALLEEYASGGFLTAWAAALQLDSDRMDAYAESGGKTEEYLRILNRLDELCNASGSTFIYVIRPDRSDYGHITFIFSAIHRSSPYTHYEFGYVRETTNDEYRSVYRELYEGVIPQGLVVRDKGYIETDPHITALIPLKKSDGTVTALLCVQRQMEGLAAVRRTYAKRIGMLLVATALLLMGGLGFYLHRVLLLPVQEITEEASRFASENVKTGRKLTESIRNRDEIGKLAAAVDLMEEQIHSYVENQTRVAAERERISTELNLATQIQENVLPREFPAFQNRTDFHIFASMRPAREVGGDFYDFFLVDDDHLAMVIADVSGKGVPAALFMMISKALIKSCAMDGESPATIFRNVNTQLCQGNRLEMFVTVWMGILELSTGKGVAANAGHEHPVLRRRDGRYEPVIYRHSPALAVMEGILFREHSFVMEPGDSLFVYTDGVPEATDEKKELFGTERMLSVLNEDPAASPEELLERVMNSLDSFAGTAPQFDDITMLCLSYAGQQIKSEGI